MYYFIYEGQNNIESCYYENINRYLKNKFMSIPSDNIYL